MVKHKLDTYICNILYSNTCDVMKSKSKLLVIRRWLCILTMRLMLVRTLVFFPGALHLLLSTIFFFIEINLFLYTLWSGSNLCYGSALTEFSRRTQLLTRVMTAFSRRTQLLTRVMTAFSGGTQLLTANRPALTPAKNTKNIKWGNSGEESVGKT